MISAHVFGSSVASASRRAKAWLILAVLWKFSLMHPHPLECFFPTQQHFTVVSVGSSLLCFVTYPWATCFMAASFSSCLPCALVTCPPQSITLHFSLSGNAARKPTSLDESPSCQLTSMFIFSLAACWKMRDAAYPSQLFDVPG